MEKEFRDKQKVTLQQFNSLIEESENQREIFESDFHTLDEAE